MNKYRIRPNYRTVRLDFSRLLKNLQLNIHLIRAHLEERSAEDFMVSVFNDAYVILFSDFLYKSICCGYSFELPRLVEAIQMSTDNIYFYKEVDKSTLAVI